MKTKRIWFAVILVLLSITSLSAQYSASTDVVRYPSPAPAGGTSRDFIPVSPTAASLGVFGHIPVGCFTGIPEVGIPLYNVSYKELSIPISINYHSAGIKPDIFPGSMGLGWTLQAGGTISRIINGSPDYEFPPQSSSSGVQPALPHIYRQDDDWHSDATMKSFLRSDPYSLETENTNDPDEFIYNFNGMSGKFFLNHKDTMEVQSTQGHYLKITPVIQERQTFEFPVLEQTRLFKGEGLGEIESNPGYVNPHPDGTCGNGFYKNTIYKGRMVTIFKIIDEKGIIYTFGDTLANSIEFSRPGRLNSEYADETLIIPMSWNLVSIESPNGYKIELSYEKETIITKIRFSDIALYNYTAYPLPCHYTVKATLINGCVIKDITFPTGKVSFRSSLAINQLDYPTAKGWSSADYIDFHQYEDVSYANTEKLVMDTTIMCDPDPQIVRNRFFPHKIDGFDVYDNFGKQCRKVDFIFSESDWLRLKLMGLDISGESEKIQHYSFSYYPGNLPPYLSFQTDHYGFYNGITLFADPIMEKDKDQGYYTSLIMNDPGYISRMKEPRRDAAEAQLLQTIEYPTGGYTYFEYESNEYGGEYKTWPFRVEETAGNELTGGMRIKRIIDCDNDLLRVKLSERIFHYTKDYLQGGIQSSSILSYTPTYVEQYAGTMKPPIGISGSSSYINYFRFSTNPIFPLSEKGGNHITYSEVTEEIVGTGFIVHKYKNYDNGYTDKPLLNKITDNEELKDFTKEDAGISMELERGQLLSEEYYDQNRILKKSVSYTYNDDETRFDEDKNIRYLRHTTNSLGVKYRSKRAAAGLHYVYYPYLKQRTETEYLNENISQTTEYRYDEKYRLLTEKMTANSNGRTISVSYKYPQHFSDPTCKEMVNRNMLDYKLRETYWNGYSTSTLQRDFSTGLCDNPRLIFPYWEKRISQDNSVQVLSTYHWYDTYGNVQHESNHSGLHSCFLWSYNRLYPVALIEGADFSQIQARLSWDFINNLGNKNMPSEEDIQTIRSRLDAPGIFITTYTYDPLIGLQSVTYPNGLSENYEYDSFGRLSKIKDHNGNVIKDYHYHYSEVRGPYNKPEKQE